MRTLTIAALLILLLFTVAVSSTSCHADTDHVFADGFDPPGVLLVGPPDSLAMDAIEDMPPRPVPLADVEDGLILTRMDVYIDRNATVGQINAILVANDARIVAMASGQPLLTVAIPRASGRPALQNLRDAFKASAGILLATMPFVSPPEIIPDPPVSDPASLAYLQASRFPAAWNLGALATRDCADHRIPMRVIDSYKILPDNLLKVFNDQIPAYLLTTAGSAFNTTHGYEVTMTAAARFDASSQTGANPFPECLVVSAAGFDTMTSGELGLLVRAGTADANGVDNLSLGEWLPCSNACSPANIDPSLAVDLASRAIAWRSLTRSHDQHDLIVAAAGNEANQPIALIYPFFGIADFGSVFNLAASPSLFGNDDASTDDDFTFLSDAMLLDPTAAGYPSLRASSDDIARLRTFESQNLAPPVGPAPNTLIVGSTTNGVDPAQVQLSAFSRRNAMVDAVGEGIPTFVGASRSGTSVATPQVSGLASYLWLLSEPLRRATVDQTVQAIIGNVDIGPAGTQLIDAYASVLSLDSADPTALVPSAETMPMRLALLDIDGDGRFTESDIAIIQEQLLLEGGVLQDWSRYDLNGDGYTGGFHAARFDLDRIGSVQFGGARYSILSKIIEDRSTYFFEPALLDSEILCYYAYSPLYTGDGDARSSLLGTTCASPLGQSDEFSFGIHGANPVQTVYGGGRAFTVGQPYGLPAHVAKFDFATSGWDTPQVLSDDWQLTPFAMAANRGEHGGIVALSRLLSFDLNSIGVSRYDAASDSWMPIETLDISAYPIRPNTIDPIGVAVSASGSALIVWKTASPPYTEWAFAAALFDSATSEWTDAMRVSDAIYPATDPESGEDAIYTKEVLADDAGDNFYINMFGSAHATYRLQTRSRSWTAVAPYPGLSWHMGLDQTGRILGMGNTGESPNQIISSHYDPATDHWSQPTVVYTASASGVPGSDSVDRPDSAFAYQGDGNEGCHLNFCVAANGDAVLLSPPDASPSAQTLRVSYYLAEIDQWVNRGVVPANTGTSVGMGYYTGNVDIAWYDGKIWTQHIDRLQGLGDAQEAFDGGAWSVVYPPIVIHDEGDSAAAIWAAEEPVPNQVMHDFWRLIH